MFNSRKGYSALHGRSKRDNKRREVKTLREGYGQKGKGRDEGEGGAQFK